MSKHKTFEEQYQDSVWKCEWQGNRLYRIYRFDEHNIVVRHKTDKSWSSPSYFTRLSGALQFILDKDPTCAHQNSLKDTLQAFLSTREELKELFELHSS